MGREGLCEGWEEDRRGEEVGLKGDGWRFTVLLGNLGASGGSSRLEIPNYVGLPDL